MDIKSARIADRLDSMEIGQQTKFGKTKVLKETWFIYQVDGKRLTFYEAYQEVVRRQNGKSA